MAHNYCLLRGLPPTVAPNMIDAMPIPVIYFNSELESLYFNAAFSSYIELDKVDFSNLVGIGTLRAVDVMPEYQPDGLHSTETLRKIIKEALEGEIHEYPWMLKTLTDKPIYAQMSVVITKKAKTVYIACYFLNTMEGTKNVQVPTRQVEGSSHLEHVLGRVSSKNPYKATGSELDQDVLEALPLIMHIWSRDFELLDCSAETINVFGVTSKDEFKQKFYTLCPEMQLGRNSKELMQEYIKLAFDDGCCKFKWLHQDVNGKLLPCEVSFCKIMHAGEECVLGFTQDFTKISNTVQEFAKMQESTRAMLDGAPIAVHLWDNNFKLRDSNLEGARLFGFEDIDGVVKNFRKIIPKHQEDGTSSIKAINEQLSKAFKEGYSRSDFVMHHQKDKTLIPIEVTLVRLSIWNEDLVAAYIRDLRDVKALINKMQSAEERIQTIFDITPLGINVWDKSYSLIECNEAIVKLYGFEDKKSYMDARYRIIPRVQPDGSPTIAIARKAIDVAFETGYSIGELVTFDVNRNPIPVEVISKRAFVQKQEVVVSYVRDLRDLKAKLAEIGAAEQELRIARDIAEQSAQAKTQFLGNMSHEIRTPLNCVLGLLHVLNITDLKPDQKDYVGKGIDAADKLLHLVNSILDFSQIDNGSFEVESAPFALDEIINEAKLVYGPQTANKNLEFKVFADDTTHRTLYGDATRLKQVVFNVLDNAIKFTSEGHITLSISCTEEQDYEVKYVFSVEDSGIGMTKTQTSNIFSAFAQVDSSITRNHTGAGLGLAIAKRIVKLMHGDMWVKTQKNKGSTFFFTAVFGRGDEQNFAIPSDNAAAQVTQQTAAPAHSIAKPSMSLGEILLVEDNNINQLIVIELLKNKGYNIDVASNGKEAVRMVQEKDYDMLLMDIQMPVMDGLTATTKIRSMKKFANLPIVAMSAHAMSGDKETCMDYGMNDHLSKPVSPPLLYEAVEKWVRR